jgi:hypothetical protein
MPMRVTLTVTEGPHQGKSFTFTEHQTFFVGRSKRCHFQLPRDDKYFSRVHFLVEVNPPHLALMDMKSRNGTHVNGEKVERIALKNGDFIKAGRTVIRVIVEATDSMPSIAPPQSPLVRPSPPTPSPAVQVPPVVHLPPPPMRPGPTTPPPVVHVPPAPVMQSPPPAPPVEEFIAVPAESDVIKAEPVAWQPPPPPAPPVVTPPPGRKSDPSVALPTGRKSDPSITLPSTAPPANPVTPPHLGVTSSAKPVASVMPCPTCGGIPAVGARLCTKCAAQSRSLPQPIKGYQIVREIGHGSMGVVSLALSETTAQAVAVKTITPAAAGTPAAVERFRREARTLRALNHPNIIALLDEGESNGILYFVMQYVEGTDAGKLLRRDGAMPVRRAIRLMGPALDALAHAHSNGFVHRDIKPSNLLVTETGGVEKVWLADFGLARVYQASEMSGLTFNGDIGGTVAFMPPEQITEYRDAKPPSDQYAAAASLYNLLTGRYVYDLPEHDFQRSLLIVLSDDPVPIEKRRTDLPRGLPQVIKKALAREPGDRFADVAGFRSALRPFEN